MNYLKNKYPDYDCDTEGNIYKKGNKIVPFKSNKYLQVCIYDLDKIKRVVGVHQVIAMKYLDFYEGCIVHHKNENTHDNRLENLEITNRAEHARYHANNLKFGKNNLGRPAWNKGKKMSEESRKKLSESRKLLFKIRNEEKEIK